MSGAGFDPASSGRGAGSLDSCLHRARPWLDQGNDGRRHRSGMCSRMREDFRLDPAFPGPPKTTGVLLLNALEDQHLPLFALERESVPCDLEPLDVRP